MAKIRVEITDLPGGSISVEVKAEENFPADSTNWTDAQRAAMHVYHSLGVPTQDLATTKPEGEG